MKRGFTLVEFAISFCLIATMSLLIFELIVSMKTLYINGNIKTTMLDKQAIMLKRIYDDYNNYELNSVQNCGTNCLRFQYSKNNNNKITDLIINKDNSTITYDDYTIKLENGTYFGEITISVNDNVSANTTINNSLLTINIPIYNKLFQGNYGLNINMPYISTVTTIDNSINT